MGTNAHRVARVAPCTWDNAAETRSTPRAVRRHTTGTGSRLEASRPFHSQPLEDLDHAAVCRGIRVRRLAHLLRQMLRRVCGEACERALQCVALPATTVRVRFGCHV